MSGYVQTGGMVTGSSCHHGAAKLKGVRAAMDRNKCTKCGVCARSCFYDAIRVTRAGAVVNVSRCDG